MRKDNILKSVIIFLFSIILLLSMKSFLVDWSNGYLLQMTNIFIDEYVNEKYIFEKEAFVVVENEEFLSVDCIFYGTQQGILKRNVKINSFLEFLLPIFILISFSISTCFYFKSKWLFLSFSIMASIYIFTIKILILIFDNYNYDEFKLSEFIFPIDQLIYFINFVLNTTGSSINFVLPILIILIQFSIFTPKENLKFINQ